MDNQQIQTMMNTMMLSAMQNMMPRPANQYSSKGQYGKGGKGKGKGTKKASKNNKGQQKGAGKKGSKSSLAKSGGKGAHARGGHVGPILPSTKPQNATTVSDTQRAQIKAIGKTLTKMRKKQSILMKQIAPTSDANTANAVEAEPPITPAPTLDDRIDAPLQESISRGKKWGKARKATPVPEAQPVTDATPGRRRKRRGGPPKVLRSHDEDSDGKDTTPAHTPAPSRPGSPTRRDAQGDAVMSDPGVPPRSKIGVTATIFSPSGVANTGWLTEVLPRSVAKKIEWISINLLHKLQEGTCTRESVVLATSGMSQWATQMTETGSEEEEEERVAQATGSRSSTDVAPPPLASPVNTMGEDDCL